MEAVAPFQLGATVNPDFGQVESDDLVISFDAVETFQSDRRPFFTENQSIFKQTTPDAGRLVHTRRIGAEADDGTGMADIAAAIKLNGSLGALGYDKLLEKTVHALPDAKDRLTYIANLTEQAACKVLNATDIANPLQEELETGAKLLADKWDAVYANRLSTQEFKLLADETRAYLKNAVPQRTAATREQLMEIMMAQDFQDLTGQVIKKIVVVAQELESQLMDVLIETMPGEKRTESVNSLLNGPVINTAGRTDIVASQQQVDDLLESLGF